jgi:hypothetical protein
VSPFDETYVQTRLREIEAFEARARGETTAKRRPPTSQHPEEFSMFQPATNSAAFLRAGITGEPGAGKTLTAALLAIALVKQLKALNIAGSDRPVGMMDTEKEGSDWLVPVFEECGIPLLVAKERSFAKALEAFKYMKENCVVGIFDSVTHPWEELKESFMKKKNRSFLQIDEYAQLNSIWKQFTDEFMNSPLHCIICGRAGDETEQWVDDNGKRQFEKVGVKMRTQKDTAYEPSLSILMERDMDLRSKIVTHLATVTKDRSTLLDGKQFTFASFTDKGDRLPTETLVKQVWAAFRPHVDRLNLGGRHVPVQHVGDSTHIIKTEKRDWQPVQRQIVLEEIQDLMTIHVPGQTNEAKTRRILLLKTHFSAGWREIETFDLLLLRAGYDALHQDLTGKPSRYAAAMEAETVPLPDMNDDLPDHSKAPLAVVTASAAA